MSYFFTKYDTRMLISFDINYAEIVDDMIKKTNPLAIIIDPMKESEESPSVDKILGDVNALDPSGGGDPTEVSKTSVSSESENILSHCLTGEFFEIK
jgi:hypothetical protein